MSQSGQFIKYLFLVAILISTLASTSSSIDQITTLGVSITTPDQEFNDNTVQIITLELSTDNLTDVSLTFTITFGELNTSSTEILDVNGTVNYSLEWTIPNVQSNMSAEFQVTASAEDITVSDTATYQIINVIGTLDVDVGLSSTEFYQNNTLDIVVTVTDQQSSQEISGASVSILLEIGKFTLPTLEDGSITLTTNTNGVAMATADFSSELLLFNENNISISFSIEADDYNPISFDRTVVVLAVPATVEMVVTHSNLIIDEKATVTFDVSLTINSQVWVNATVQAVATGGEFSDGEILQSLRTNEMGKASFVWTSEFFPDLSEDQSVSVTIKLLTPGYEVDDQQFTITISADQATDLSFDTDSNSSPFPLFLGLMSFIASMIFTRRKEI